MQSVPIFNVHVLRHFLHNFGQLVEIKFFAFGLAFVEFGSRVTLAELLQVGGNALESLADVGVLVFL